MLFLQSLWKGEADERLLPPWEIIERGLSFDRGWYEQTSQGFGFFSTGLNTWIDLPDLSVSDHASIPWGLLPQMCRDHPVIAYGSKIHDILCQWRGVLPGGIVINNTQAAYVLAWECMKSCGADNPQSLAVYEAVKVFGPQF